MNGLKPEEAIEARANIPRTMQTPNITIILRLLYSEK